MVRNWERALAVTLTALALSWTAQLGTLPAYAASSGPAIGLSDDGVVHATTKKKKKKKKTTSTKATISIDSLSSGKRGESSYEVTAKVSKSGLSCDLKVTFANDTKVEDLDVSADGKTCTMSIDIPSSKGVVGEATAEVILRDSAGKKLDTEKKTFNVK